jgi:histidinol-phosphate aminotransferase
VKALEERINRALLDIHPYVPGRSREEILRERGIPDVVKMASNENALGVSPLAAQAIQKAMGRVHQYPEVSTPALRTALAGRLGVDPDQIITGNGADGVIYALAMTLLSAGDQTIIPAITFPMYEVAARAMGCTVVTSPMAGYHLDLDDILSRITGKTRVIWICNPNNPTGTMVDHAGLSSFLERVPEDVWVVHDEVYVDFSDLERFPDSRALLEKHKNLFCIRSFSKVYGLAGIRLGYGFGSPELVRMIYRVRPPFDVSVLAEQAGIGALRDEEFYHKTVGMTADGRRSLCERLESMGLSYVPSHTNFVLVDTGRDDGDLADRLISRGVIIRPAGAYQLPGHLRITIGDARQNARLVEALEGALSTE